MCDVESYIYLPLLEELGYVPKEKYAHAPEILAHSRAIGEHFDLYDNACFQTEVTELRWDDDDRRAGSSRPTAATGCGPASWCMANGPLHRPKLPGIPGIETFEGHTFHTSRWDYDYTGGDSDGNLTGLRRQARRHHRHRRHRGAVRPAPRRGGRAAVRVPAHAVVDRRARQPADRSGVGGEPRAGLAAAADGQLQHARLRRLRAGGPGQRRLDRHHRQAARDGAQRRERRRPDAGRRWRARWSWPTSRRWSRSAPASTRSSTTRPPPRR